MGIFSGLKEMRCVLGENLQKGHHLEPMAVEDMEEHVCLNCHTSYRGYFCPRCGQSAGTTRLTIMEGLSTAMSGILKFNRGMSHTLLELIYRPGYLAYDYVKGYRKEYYPPVTLLIILVAIPLFLSTFIPSGGSAVQMLVVALAENFKERGISTPLFGYMQKVVTIGSVRVLLEALMTVPSIWLCFHWTRGGRQTNWAETFFLSVFVACNELLLGLLLFPVEFITLKTTGLTLSGWLLGGPVNNFGIITQEYISEYLTLAVQVWIFHSFYKTSWAGSILRYILYLLLVLATFSLLTILLVIGILFFCSPK